MAGVAGAAGLVAGVGAGVSVFGWREDWTPPVLQRHLAASEFQVLGSFLGQDQEQVAHPLTKGQSPSVNFAQGSPQDKSPGFIGPFGAGGLLASVKTEGASLVLHRHLAFSDFHERGSSFGQESVHFLQLGVAAHSPSVKVGQSSPHPSASALKGAEGFSSVFSLTGPTSVHLHFACSDFQVAGSPFSHDKVHLLHPSTKAQSYSDVV